LIVTIRLKAGATLDRISIEIRFLGIAHLHVS
jgi:hypothetical protein